MDDRELFAKGPPEAVDNTILSNWTTCRRRLYWFLRGLDYKSIPAYFVYGRCFGTAVNIWHGRNGEDPLERIAEAVNAAQEIWQAEAPLEVNGNDTWEGFKEMFKQYCGHYGKTEPWSMAYRTGEKGFSLPLPSFPSVFYAGAMDAPILWKPYGMMVREDKTTGSWVNQGFMDQWDYSTQVTGYIWAGRSIVEGMSNRCYMNVAGKTPRYEGQGKAKRPAPELRFSRYLTERTEDQLERFVAETGRLAREIWQEWEKGSWNWDKTGMRNQINCTGGMGRSRCLYSSLCKLDLEPWEMEEHNFLDEFTWRGKWAPWERDGGD